MESQNYINELVSVIIPTYKRCDMLKRAINSVLHQTYSYLEVLIVDDNNIGDEYSNKVKIIINSIKDNRIRLITQPTHINGAAARNAGIKASKGEFIAFLDDDDFWHYKKIEKQIEVLKKLPANYGGVGTELIQFKNENICRVIPRYTDKDQNFKTMSRLIEISICAVLLKRNCLDETGYFDESLLRHQEVQLFSYFTEKYKIYQIREPLTYIDISDSKNRPSVATIEDRKNDFYKSISPLILKLSDKRKRIFYAMNNSEIYWLMIKEKKYKQAINGFNKIVRDPVVFVYLLRRFIERKIGQLRVKALKKETILELSNIINIDE
ncbi:MAG TPA: glycosyltransferase family 2 protein [Gallicola sp.]|nr:glycosyltransferase family 2 protein [Gallicola sp.]